MRMKHFLSCLVYMQSCFPRCYYYPKSLELNRSNWNPDTIL